MKLTKKEQYMEKKIAIVRLHRGVLDPITQVNKLMTFICDKKVISLLLNCP